MSKYQVYRFLGASLVVGRTEFSCADDLTASKKTRHILTNGDKELWAGDRFIARVDILGQDVLVDPPPSRPAWMGNT
jgi:hypothetical protein